MKINDVTRHSTTCVFFSACAPMVVIGGIQEQYARSVQLVRYPLSLQDLKKENVFNLAVYTRDKFLNK